jgi:hypothetical protein
VPGQRIALGPRGVAASLQAFPLRVPFVVRSGSRSSPGASSRAGAPRDRAGPCASIRSATTRSSVRSHRVSARVAARVPVPATAHGPAPATARGPARPRSHPRPPRSGSRSANADARAPPASPAAPASHRTTAPRNTHPVRWPRSRACGRSARRRRASSAPRSATSTRVRESGPRRPIPRGPRAGSASARCAPAARACPSRARRGRAPRRSGAGGSIGPSGG